MSDDDSERQREAERLLLRSARLDAPRPAARSRAFERVLAQAEASSFARTTRSVALCAGAFALAAGAALLSRSHGNSSSERAQAEAPRGVSQPAIAPSASAEPALAPCPKLTVAKGGVPLIDDLEDRNARMLIADGRDGTWMVFNDGSGKQVPPGLSVLHPERLLPARGQSRYALHTSGGKFDIWGSILVGSFTDGGCYDLSAYRGIEFWAKGNTRIYLQLSVIDEISAESGGLCKGKGCYSSPQKPFDLGREWHKYGVRFAELEQLNQPSKMRFDPKRVVSLNLSIHREDTPFDLWIDDVRFVEPE